MLDQANMRTLLLILLLLLTQTTFVVLVRVCHPHNQLARERPTPDTAFLIERVTSSIFDKPVSTCEAGLKCIQFCEHTCARCTFMVLSKLHVRCGKSPSLHVHNNHVVGNFALYFTMFSSFRAIAGVM